jgi:ABC-type Fe3+-hydroxamate transport system substrate-binding protein
MAGLAMGLSTLILVLCLPINSIANEKAKITDMLGRGIVLPSHTDRLIPLGSALRFLTYMQCLDKVVLPSLFKDKRVSMTIFAFLLSKFLVGLSANIR